MRTLILSCNTGEGHNAAGRAMKEYLESIGEPVEMLDYMQLAGERTSRVIGGAYVGIAKHTPSVFHLAYRVAGGISSRKHKSPVYYANALMARHLHQYLLENKFDVILMPHLYPAETLTRMKAKKWLTQKTVVIATDYTCVPFWEETDCDAYILPHEDLMEEYIARGVDAARLHPFGIPVKAGFRRRRNRSEVRERLGLPTDRVVYLIMSGSMGFGKIKSFTAHLCHACQEGEHIVVICGHNQKLYRSLQCKFRWEERVHVVGFTEHVAAYMDACDLIYTKPGGLTSTEVAVKNMPLVHTAPIPGCETMNMEFFIDKGMSVHEKSMKGLIALGKHLTEDEQARQQMLAAQKKHAKPHAAEQIYRLMLEMTASD